MCVNSVKKLPVLVRYVSDKYKTQKMCDEDVVKNCGTLEFVPYNCKCQKCVIKLMIIM